ncbi:MAG: hypothetical protein ACXVCP_19195 [Bdellovibrio sp.]
MKIRRLYTLYSSAISVMVVALMLSACGKDHDLQDYNNDLLVKKLAKLQAVQGSYSGYVVSKKDNSNMGAMKVTLTAKTKVIDGTTSSGSSAQAVLAVNVEFQGVSKMAVVAKDSFFDSERGQFQTDIPIKIKNSRGQDEEKTITISGVVAGDHLIGELQGLEFPEYGAKIDLNRDNVSLEALTKKIPPKNITFTNGGYIGTTRFAKGPTKNVLMVLSKPNTTSELDFYYVFSPVKPVLITLNYGQDAQISFANGNWDQRVGKLTGQSKLPQTQDKSAAGAGPTDTGSNSAGSNSLSIDISLMCDVVNGNGFSCKVEASNSIGSVAEIRLAENTDGSEISDDNANRDAITKTYKGTFIFNVNDNKVPAVLSVTYPARTRLEEITNLFFPKTEIYVVVDLNIKRIGLSFSKVKFDTAKGTLDTTQSPDGVTARLTLSCQNFHFEDEDEEYYFQCSYHSNGTVNAQLEFKSKP